MFKSKSLQRLCDILYDETNNPYECWEWNGVINNKGYGRVYFEGKYWLTHRVSYIILVGQIPEKLLVLHNCDNSICVNPNHLRLGNNSENMNDRYNRGTTGKRKNRIRVNENTRIDKNGNVVYVKRAYSKKGRCFSNWDD
jgi:hypothetical protein